VKGQRNDDDLLLQIRIRLRNPVNSLGEGNKSMACEIEKSHEHHRIKRKPALLTLLCEDQLIQLSFSAPAANIQKIYT
jgi:hypothetical protein